MYMGVSIGGIQGGGKSTTLLIASYYFEKANGLVVGLSGRFIIIYVIIMNPLCFQPRS